MSDERLMKKQLLQLREHYPQAHADRSNKGNYLVTVPGVLLRGYREDICTVLFVVKNGYPFEPPHRFYTDIQIRLKNGALPHAALLPSEFAAYGNSLDEWPQWKNCMLWFWRVRMWSPRYDTLFTYAKVIERRFALGV